MADQDRRDGDTARASAGSSDDETAALPDLRPTERVDLAWSAEQSEPDHDFLAYDDDAPITPMPPPMAPQSQARKTGAVLVVFWLLMAVALLYSCTKSEDSAAPSSPTSAPPSLPPPPPPFKAIPGDGTYNMGGADGKDWGIWESSGGSANCQWSIHAVSRYTPGQVLDSGGADMNQQVRVSIQPLPDSSGLTGESHGFRVVFMTNGCGSWRLVD